MSGFFLLLVIGQNINNQIALTLASPMAKRVRILGLNCLVFLLAITASFLIGTKPALASAITAPRLIQLINNARHEAGLPTLSVNHQLTQAALKKARHLLKGGYFAHTTPAGKPFYQWAAEENYNYLYAGENLAIDFSTSEGTVAAWLASESHRANIMNEHYTETGLATVSGFFQGRQTTVAVQMFGSTLPENYGLEPTILGKTINLANDNLIRRRKELAQVASELILLPSAAGRKYLDIIIKPKLTSWPVRLSAAAVKDITASANTNFVPGNGTQRLVEVSSPGLGNETGLVISSNEGAVILSAPILYPTLSSNLTNVKNWPLRLPSVSGQLTFNLLLAALASLLLLSAYRGQISPYFAARKI